MVHQDLQDPPWEADPGAARTTAGPPADLPGGLRMAWPKRSPAECFENGEMMEKKNDKNRGKTIEHDGKNMGKNG